MCECVSSAVASFLKHDKEKVQRRILSLVCECAAWNMLTGRGEIMEALQSCSAAFVENDLKDLAT